MRIPQNLLRVYNMLMKTPSSSSWHLLYNFSIEKISRMVWNNFMMHLCIVATLCFFKIISPRNYYYCDQDDFPWVCGSKYVSKSNCCHRHLILYISDVKKFPYLPKIYISAIYLAISLPLWWWWALHLNLESILCKCGIRRSSTTLTLKSPSNFRNFKLQFFASIWGMLCTYI